MAMYIICLLTKTLNLLQNVSTSFSTISLRKQRQLEDLASISYFSILGKHEQNEFQKSLFAAAPAKN